MFQDYKLRTVSVIWIVFLFVCCVDNKEINLFPETLLHEGDLVFRKGTGLVSRAVLSADGKGTYSHIGIVVRDGNEWKVVHAVPGEPDYEGEPDRVKIENVQEFFGKEKAVAGALMRFTEDSLVAIKAARKAIEVCDRRTLFDHTYNLEDSTAMYCTELVYFVYKYAGVDLVEGRTTKVNIPGFIGSYIFPSDIIEYKRLVLIYNF